MYRFALRLIATLTLGGLGFVGLAGPTAGSALAAPAASFAGSYTFHLRLDGRNIKFPAQINADGTAVAAGGTAHWTSKGKTITIVYKNTGTTETFVGNQSKKGIASKKKPGSYSDNHGATGTWYAIRTS